MFSLFLHGYITDIFFLSFSSSPSVSSEVKNEYYDDSQTPLVPLIPIEGEESPDTPVSTTISSQQPLPQVPLPSGPHVSKCDSHSMEPLASAQPFAQPSSAKLPDLGADVVAAAYTALTAITTCNENGNLIDTDLLIKILNDPKMIQKLMNNGPPANTGIAPISESKTVTSSVPVTIRTPDTERPADENSFHVPNGVRTTLNKVSLQHETHPISRFQQVVTTKVPSSKPVPVVSLPRLSDENSFNIPNQMRSAVNVASVQPNTAPPISTFVVKEQARPMKDLNYYKNLIRQHGGEKVENKETIHAQNQENYHHFEEPKPVQNYKPGELKLKNSKLCMYFKTSKGCRNGANCPYQHDVPKQWRAAKVIDTHSAKRMKLTGEIYGRMLV